MTQATLTADPAPSPAVSNGWAMVLRCTRIGMGVLIWGCLLLSIGLTAFTWLTPIDLHTQEGAYEQRFANAYLISTVRHYIGFAAIVAAIVAMVLKLRWTALASVIVSFIVGSSFWLSMLPRFTPHADGPGLRVMTANLYYQNKNADQLVASIRESGADVVALVELTPVHRRAILDQLTNLYPHMDLIPANLPGGMGLLSKVPFEDQTIRNNRPVTPWRKYKLDMHGTPITLHVVHLCSPGLDVHLTGGRLSSLMGVSQVNMNRRQLHYVLQNMLEDDGPTLMCGDFNSTPDTLQHQALRKAGFTSAYDIAGYGPGYTWPTNRPEMGHATWLPGFRIDHILMDDQLTATSAFIGQPTGSDHRPVIADIKLKKLEGATMTPVP